VGKYADNGSFCPTATKFMIPDIASFAYLMINFYFMITLFRKLEVN